MADENPTPTEPGPCGGTDGERKGYLSFDPLNLPRAGTFYEFTSCCCPSPDPATPPLSQLLYDFIIGLMAANPQIVKVEIKKSPNGACEIVLVRWNLSTTVSTQTAADIIAILQYYLMLLGY